MKQFISFMTVVGLCLSLTACFTEAPYVPATVPNTDTISTTPTLPVVPTTDVTSPTETTVVPPFSMEPYPYPLTAVSLPVHQDTRYAEDGKEIFRYTYQTMSLVTPYPDAAHQIAVNFLNQMDSSHSAAQTVDKAAMSAYSGQADWTPYFYQLVYTPTRLDQSILSLYGTKTYYDGAPHSNIIAHGLTYDLLHGTLLTLPQLLVQNYDSARLSSLICDNFDEKLIESFYPDYQDVILDMFSTNIPVQDWYLDDQGLCFFFNPGEIAPYSEEIPVSIIPYSDLTGLLQDAFFPAEFAEYYGMVTLNEISATEIPDSGLIAELIVDPEADYYCLNSIGTVQNLQIMIGSWNDGEFEPTVTVFAAQALSPNDSIVIQATQEWIDEICISYLSGKERHLISAKDAVIIYGK